MRLMDSLGINVENLIIQLIVIGIWPILVLWTLFNLRRARLAEMSKAVWAILIIVVPILGALAFLIVKPGKENQNSNL